MDISYSNKLMMLPPFILETGDGNLLPNWERAYDKETQRYFYVDHNTKTTTWLDPRTRGTMPQSVKDCNDDELPYGWEKVDDPRYGVYYIDHHGKRNQRTNPVSDYRQRMSQHHYSNSQYIRCMERNGNSLESNNRSISPVTPASKPDTSYQTPDLEKSTTSLNNSTNLDDLTHNDLTHNSTRGSQYDASLLDIMDNHFGRDSSQSVEV